MTGFSSLLDFPNELLLKFKDAIDPADLLTHACYYSLCSRTRVCYSTTPEDEWKYMVRASGMGLSKDELAADIKWSALAIQCAQHAWECKHPGCGVEQIQWNAMMMEKARAEPEWQAVGWDFSEVPEATHGAGSVTANPIFAHVNFNSSYEQNPRPDIRDIAFLARPENKMAKRAWAPDDLLRGHPIAAHSFASVPPVARMRLMDTQIGGINRNEAGLTVCDVLAHMGTELPRDMSTSDLHLHLNEWVDPDTPIFPSSWSVKDCMWAVQSVGGWFQLVEWRLEFDELCWGADARVDWRFALQYRRKSVTGDAKSHSKRYQ